MYGRLVTKSTTDKPISRQNNYSLQLHAIAVAEERVARALRHLTKDAGFLSSTDGVLTLIDD